MEDTFVIPEHIEKIIDAVHAEALTWDPEFKKAFFESVWNGDSLTQYHFTLGRYIRNTYNLWEFPWEPEIINGCDYSPFHPDQLSNTIIQEVWKRGPNKQ